MQQCIVVVTCQCSTQPLMFQSFGPHHLRPPSLRSLHVRMQTASILKTLRNGSRKYIASGPQVKKTRRSSRCACCPLGAISATLSVCLKKCNPYLMVFFQLSAYSGLHTAAFSKLSSISLGIDQVRNSNQLARRPEQSALMSNNLIACRMEAHANIGAQSELAKAKTFRI